MNRREFIKGGAMAAALGAGGCVTIAGTESKKLALLGGLPIIAKDKQADELDMFQWPRVNAAMRQASDAVLVGCKMSANKISLEFEEKFAKWQGTKYALTFRTARIRSMPRCMRSASGRATR